MDKISEFKKEIAHKKVAVLGIGISHKPLIKYLSNLGAEITAFDKRTSDNLQSEMDELYDCNVKYVLGGDYLSHLDAGFDYIFKTPGLRKDIPEIVQAVENGAILTNEMELFFKLCPCEIFALTGSDGKTTTTTLIYEILSKAGFKCWKGGNIGTPLLDKVEMMSSDDKVVVELSSFQLDAMDIAPNVAVITNLSPNHLDWHTDYQEYINSKLNILGDFENEKSDNFPSRVVYNLDNMDSIVAFAKYEYVTSQFVNKPIVMKFAIKNVSNSNVVLSNDKIYVKHNGNIYFALNINDIRLPGMHNVENYMAAIATTWGIVPVDVYQKVAKEFAGVEHRIEFVREFDGVKYYNDSIASSPKRTIAGLKAFDKKIILLAGGKDKGIPYDEIGKPILENVKSLILIGATAKSILKATEDAAKQYGLPMVDVKIVEDYKSMCEYAKSIAKNGDVVMLSPASTSFDMFKNFEHRGNTFKDIINNF